MDAISGGTWSKSAANLKIEVLAVPSIRIVRSSTCGEFVPRQWNGIYGGIGMGDTDHPWADDCEHY